MIELLHYFLRNPQAVDTLEGIARWRLLEEQIHRTLLETKNCLGFLVAKGFLIVESTLTTEPLYRLNHSLSQEIAEFLEQKEKESGT
jgi:hypothetical protein